MVRLFGFGRLPKRKKSPQNNNNNPLSDLPYLDEDLHPTEHQQQQYHPDHAPERERRKFKRSRRRLVATARSPELLRDRHPMFQYALNEYAQTVTSGTSNDDGKRLSAAQDEDAAASHPASPAVPPAPSSLSSVSHQQQRIPDPPSMSSTQVEPSMTRPRLDRQGSSGNSSSSSFYQYNNNNVTETTKAAAQSIVAASSPNSTGDIYNNPLRSRFEDEMPTPGYQEYYGDAYTGAPMKYVYPAGYQSMRPRSCPWRLSMIISVLFTWLSIFIVGHCSDQVDADLYYNAVIDDDTLMIDVRWCGSRPLYLMWVASMLINGLAAAYCGVIGYVKCRDFAVANTRAQPVSVLWSSPAFNQQAGPQPAVSDYYVRLGPAGDEETASSASSSASALPSYRTTIYQADGTPQFWGQQIYRPTQAAVAVTSR